MQRHSWFGAGTLCFIGFTLAGPARAEEPSSAARAETLFHAGRQLMRERRYAEACPKLAESQRLDPAPGTRLNLADCWEHEGRMASAQREFLAVAASAEKDGEKERAAVARARANQLENKVTKLALMVPAESRVPGLQVFRNSVLVVEADWSKPEPVDPGPFLIEARAPGRRSYRSEFKLSGDGATHNLTIPPLISDRGPAAPAPPVAASRGQWLQRGGIALAGIGVAGVALGAVFGVRAVNLYHRSQDEGCDDDDACPAGALETRRSAVRAGNASTVALVAGGALLAGGAGIYVWGARERASERAVLAARVAPLLGGAFASVSADF
jgi:hypothetical protein